MQSQKLTLNCHVQSQLSASASLYKMSLYIHRSTTGSFHLELQRIFSSRSSSHGGKCSAAARASHLIAERKLRGASRAPPPRVRDVHSIRKLFYFTPPPKMFYAPAYTYKTHSSRLLSICRARDRSCKFLLDLPAMFLWVSSYLFFFNYLISTIQKCSFTITKM